MAKPRIISGKKICQILSKHGFQNVRQRGSHIIMQKKTGSSTITIPIPNHKEIKLGTLKSIIRQSQLPINEFKS
ncbi:MAG: type II toxin-antitoxin system HicA family toxin [Actinobacteria bacterium]|nr:type II toxin-antitoxin system HicA family toxin [Actinomycetota bacterium]